MSERNQLLRFFSKSLTISTKKHICDDNHQLTKKFIFVTVVTDPEKDRQYENQKTLRSWRFSFKFFSCLNILLMNRKRKEEN